jgi:peroxiredoxin
VSETATLKVGDEAPDFELPANPAGEKFKLSDHRGKNAVILNFVPAAFSPVCSAQLPLIEKMKDDFSSQGAVPVVISSDGPWAQAAWREQLGVSYPILSDFSGPGRVADAYGVLIKERGIANRVVIVVGKNGKVAWIQPSVKIVEHPDYDPVLSCAKD